MAFKAFYYRDQPILDIEEWALVNGEKMVDIIWKIKEVNPYARKAKSMISYYEEKDTMPESFFNTLRIPPNHLIKSYKTRDPITKKRPVTS